MGDRPAKDDLFDALASAAKALGNGRRAELVDVLTQGQRSVDELATEIEQTVANTSQHLQVLLRAGLVRTQRHGTRIFYSLATPEVSTLWAAMRQVAADHVAELDALALAYLGDRSEFDTISREDLLDRLHAGDVVVLDVRPTAEYRTGHIPGALSVPIATLGKRLRQLPADTPIVAYCRGTYCVYADDAVRLLRRHGYRAARLDDGFPEWTRAQLPVETGAA